MKDKNKPYRHEIRSKNKTQVVRDKTKYRREDYKYMNISEDLENLELYQVGKQIEDILEEYFIRYPSPDAELPRWFYPDWEYCFQKEEGKYVFYSHSEVDGELSLISKVNTPLGVQLIMNRMAFVRLDDEGQKDIPWRERLSRLKALEELVRMDEDLGLYEN